MHSHGLFYLDVHVFFHTDIKFNALLLMGHVNRLTGSIQEATQCYQDAGLIFSKESDHSCLAEIYQQLCVYATNNNDKALEGLNWLLVNRSDTSVKTQGILYQSLGNVYRSIADYHNATKHFKEAIQLGKIEGDEYKVMERRAELGRVYRSSGCHKKALKRQKMFLQFSLSHGYVYSVSVACGYIGFTNYTMGLSQFEEALKYLNVRITLCKHTLMDQAGYRWSLNNIGKVYLALKDHSLCMHLFQESCDIAKQHGTMLGIGTAYGNMGSACRAVGKHQDAVFYHEKYLEIAESTFDTGGILIMQKELILDHIFLYQSHKEQEMKNSMLNVAMKYAIQCTRTCVEVRKRLSTQDDLLKIGNFEKNESQTYALLQYILVLQGLLEAALLVAEYGRARALADVVKEKIKPIETQFLTNILNICDDHGNLLHERVASEVKSVKTLLSDLKSDLFLYSMVVDPLTLDTLIYTWHIAHNKTTTSSIDSSAIHFNSSLFNHSPNSTQQSVTIDDAYFTTLMQEIGTKQGLISRDVVPKRSQNKQQPQKVPERDKERDNKTDALKELYSLLISPMLRCLASNELPKRIIIVPQGCLFSVPYCALRNPNNDRYLIQDFIISLSPSIYLLCLNNLKKRPTTDLNVLAVGNPQMPLEEIDQLPGAEKEVGMVLSILDGKKLCGSEATKDKVIQLLPHFPIVHLATHAILEESLTDHIMASDDTTHFSVGDYSVKGAIVLAKSNNSCSGVLTSSEILDLDLNCNLFVLSCCNTACGKVTGDGILGLSRSLMCAGAMNIIVTLWPVQDASTTLLMNTFYRQYYTTCDGPASLHYSMISLIEQKYKVEQWAPFCYLGQ